jgi:hypothetical protein
LYAVTIGDDTDSPERAVCSYGSANDRVGTWEAVHDLGSAKKEGEQSPQEIFKAFLGANSQVLQL